MSVVAVIAACSASVDHIDLLLQPIAGIPVICHTYQSAAATGLFASVTVITNDERIEKAIKAIDGNVMLITSADSTFESVAKISLTTLADHVVYINGNIPLIEKAPVQKMLEQFEGSLGKNIEAVSMVQKIHDTEKINDVNCVKATLDLRLFALYFSRSPIPYIQNNKLAISYYEHISIFAFKKDLLMKMMVWPVSPLERAEDIEALRLIENGVQIKMLINQFSGIEIHSQNDMAAAAAALMSKTA